MSSMTFWLYIGLLAALLLTNWRVNKAIGWAANNERNGQKLHKMTTVNHALILLLQDERDGEPNNRPRIMEAISKLEADIPPEMLIHLRKLSGVNAHETD